MGRQAPQAFCEDPCPVIPLTPVDSNQVGAIGYDAESKTLAATFKFTPGVLYCYPNVSPDTVAAFLAAESKGTFFGEHIKPLAFKKYRIVAPAS